MNKVAVYFDDDILSKNNKMGISVLLFSYSRCVCVINQNNVGKSIRDFYPFLENIKIVGNIDEAIRMGAESLLLGLAPQGGTANPKLLDIMQNAAQKNLTIIHGFHQTDPLTDLGKKYPNLVVDLRTPKKEYLCKSLDKVRFTNKNRILMVGTDMAVGKMTAGLLIHKKTQSLDWNCEFVATGQIGIAITGKGVPLDAIKLDFTGGAIEKLVLDSEADTVIVEGQGSIINPSSSATLPLIRGSSPTHLVLCHDASLISLKDFAHIKIPCLKSIIDLYEDIAEACGLYQRPKTIGICVNTASMSEADAKTYMDEISKITGKVVVDPVRDYDQIQLILDGVS